MFCSAKIRYNATFSSIAEGLGLGLWGYKINLTLIKQEGRPGRGLGDMASKQYCCTIYLGCMVIEDILKSPQKHAQIIAIYLTWAA